MIFKIHSFTADLIYFPLERHQKNNILSNYGNSSAGV